ncbi:hypothetical protein, partial [Acinetobacter baumannii]
YRWTDRVLLQRQDRDWKVMDIRWGQGGNLIGRLKAFSAFRCTPSGSWPGATRRLDLSLPE